jgi:hypothetical protein
MTDLYFNLGEVCPASRKYILHSTVTTVRCGHCGLLNPNFDASTNRKPRPSGIEIIDLEASPVISKPPPPYTRPLTPIHFAVGVAHFRWDELEDGEGGWSAAANLWSVDEDNREISSQGLLETILSKIRLQTKRANLEKWLHPGPFGEWSLGYTNPTKSTPRDIVPWEDARLLSLVIDAGLYEQNVLEGKSRKLVTIWMYWTGDGPTTP